MQNTALLTHTVSASGGVTKHRCVGFDGAQVDTNGALALGVARNDAEDGDDLAVVAKGTAIAEAGGVVAVGDELVAGTDGRVIVNPDAGGEHVVGHALEGGDSGHFIEILLR
ncbi:capsid cement protein [Thioalkalivibrio sp. ALMg9]|uniref:capsid cement protein n=1 Tax=Thioalkalivibrio sp. ALMg9 TaxID=1266912 RepID=UPI00036E3E9A|nr:capsid cement protein [Thioalkalivibrio sp. ALMg9]